MMWRKVGFTRADSLIILALVLGLLASLFILIKPYPSGQMGLPSSINVVATAQAMQTHRQQVELETAHQSQKAAWAAELAKKRQEIFQANRQGQAQIAPLQARLSDLQTQINQTQANLQAMPQKITEIQQAIQADEAAYQSQLTALKADLEPVQTQPATEPAYLSGVSPTTDHEPASSSPTPADTPAIKGNHHDNEPENNSSNHNSHPQTDDGAED